MLCLQKVVVIIKNDVRGSLDVLTAVFYKVVYKMFNYYVFSLGTYRICSCYYLGDLCIPMIVAPGKDNII